MTALRVLAVTGLCAAGWLTVAAILVDTAANALYQWTGDER